MARWLIRAIHDSGKKIERESKQKNQILALTQFGQNMSVNGMELHEFKAIDIDMVEDAE